MMKPPQLLVLNWQDTKCVHIFSSTSKPQESEKGTPERIEQPCLPAVVEYRKYMGGVDTNEQLLANTPSLRKSKKWYHLIAFHYLDSAIVNAWIMEKSQPGKKQRRLVDFKAELVQELIGSFTSRKRTGRPRMSSQIRYHYAHVVVAVESINGVLYL